MSTLGQQQDDLARATWRLHQLSAEAEMIYELSAGEVTDEAALLEQWIAESSDATLQALCNFRGEIEGRLLSIAKEQERLKEAKAACDAKLEWTKARVIDVMRHLGERSKDVGTYHISLRAGTERLETDPNAAPDLGMLQMIDESLVRVSEPKIEPNRPAILRAIKAGKNIPGYIAVRGEESVAIK